MKTRLDKEAEVNTVFMEMMLLTVTVWGVFLVQQPAGCVLILFVAK